MKNFLIAAFALCLLAIPARAEKPIFMPHPVPFIPPPQTCQGGVRFTLDGAAYNLPRLPTMDFRKEDGTIIDANSPNHPFKNCAVHDLGAVISFSTGFEKKGDINIELSSPTHKGRDGNPYISNYTSYKNMIQESIDANAVLMFQGGMQKLGWANTHAYLLPILTSPTQKKDEPAVIRCLLNNEKDLRQGFCTAAYFLPSGEFLFYSFSKIYYPEKSYPLLDQKIREQIEGWKVKK
ncbi:MAG: hypothetical protein DI551_08270 [Micavibrio aeruginosavorus]|uniref:Uncharacterized protein n=1 Tax=Micavibrio aeruginosavorus TaxID=349221 RepID=A0A2W5MXS7_9BACT|nr:MAG: hypothetical protein DI551_08270 [Micavibrio aeruginosavorus]